MNYCPNCGSNNLDFKIPKEDNLPRYICQKCLTVHYNNPKVIVGCIPVYKGDILLAKRGIEPRKGYWNLPCGFLEMNESVEQGAVREVLEETGSEVNIKHLHTVYNILEHGQVYLIFIAEMSSDYFHLTAESTEVALFKIKDIPWNNIAFNANTFALKNYIQDLKNNNKTVHIGTYI